MTDAHWECAVLVADLFYGFNHILGVFNPKGNSGRHLEITVPGGNWASSFDYDGLTRAVVMAHDRMIRFEIAPSTSGRFKLSLEKRYKRDGEMRDRHPTLEHAITSIRQGLCVEPRP